MIMTTCDPRKKSFRSVDVAPRGSVTSTSFMLMFMLSSAVSTVPLKR